MDDDDLDKLAEYLRSHATVMAQAGLAPDFDADSFLEAELKKVEVIDGREATRLEHFTSMLKEEWVFL